MLNKLLTYGKVGIVVRVDFLVCGLLALAQSNDRGNDSSISMIKQNSEAVESRVFCALPQWGGGPVFYFAP